MHPDSLLRSDPVPVEVILPVPIPSVTDPHSSARWYPMVAGLPILLGLVSGCTTPIPSSEMLPQHDFYDALVPGQYQDGIYVRSAQVAKDVGGSYFSVTPEAFKTALISTLRQADLYANQDNARYVLDATFKAMKVPVFGLNMTAKTTIDYTLIQQSNGVVVFQDTMTLPCTKTFTDAFSGEVRARMASGCAVGENLTHAVKVLTTH